MLLMVTKRNKPYISVRVHYSKILIFRTETVVPRIQANYRSGLSAKAVIQFENIRFFIGFVSVYSVYSVVPALKHNHGIHRIHVKK